MTEIDQFKRVIPHLMPRPGRRKLLWLREGQKCHWCLQPTLLVYTQQPDQATVDHIVPRHKGGESTPENLVSACYRCNNRRNYEDAAHLPEGALLGLYKQGNWRKSVVQGVIEQSARVALTGDEKRATLQPAPQKPPHLILQIAALQSEVARTRGEVEAIKAQLATVTLGTLLKKWLSQWFFHG